MKVVVENLTGTLFFIQVGNDATVSELKRQIAAQENLPRDRLILILDANDKHPINDDGGGASLVDHGVHDGSHIFIFFNPLDDGSSQSRFFTLPDSPLWQVGDIEH